MSGDIVHKAASYRPANCCGSADCDYLGDVADEPCWGQVEMDSPGDDEDGWPIPGHLCQGHRDWYDWQAKERSYHAEPSGSSPLTRENKGLDAGDPARSRD
jgi:hypothetical protein